MCSKVRMMACTSGVHDLELDLPGVCTPWLGCAPWWAPWCAPRCAPRFTTKCPPRCAPFVHSKVRTKSELGLPRVRTFARVRTLLRTPWWVPWCTPRCPRLVSTKEHSEVHSKVRTSRALQGAQVRAKLKVGLIVLFALGTHLACTFTRVRTLVRTPWLGCAPGRAHLGTCVSFNFYFLTISQVGNSIISTFFAFSRNF